MAYTETAQSPFEQTDQDKRNAYPGLGKGLSRWNYPSVIATESIVHAAFSVIDGEEPVIIGGYNEENHTVNVVRVIGPDLERIPDMNDEEWARLFTEHPSLEDGATPTPKEVVPTNVIDFKPETRRTPIYGPDNGWDGKQIIGWKNTEEIYVPIL